MKKMNNKGFTIVELVIVIAVIAILAAVMIPTFSGIVDKANSSAVQQKAAAEFKEVYAKDLSDGLCDGFDKSAGGTGVDLKGGFPAKYSYATENGAVKSFVYIDNGYKATFNGTAWTITDAE